MEICFIGDRVAYIPYHANGDINHPDVEYGIVTGMNKEYVFVRFGNEEISKAVIPLRLQKVEKKQ